MAGLFASPSHRQQNHCLRLSPLPLCASFGNEFDVPVFIPLSERIRNAITGCIMIVMGTVFVGGGILYPDAPIQPCHGPGGYCGKMGQPQTLEHYNGYKTWTHIMFIVWPTGILAAGILQMGRGKKP